MSPLEIIGQDSISSSEVCGSSRIMDDNASIEASKKKGLSYRGIHLVGPKFIGLRWNEYFSVVWHIV